VISFRYHIVSIVSVFLALAVGVALGGGPLKGEVDNTLVDQVHHDRVVTTGLRAQVTSLRKTNAFVDDFAATAAPDLLGRSLRGHQVAVVVLPTAKQSDAAALGRLVRVAGGRVTGTVLVGKQLLDAGRRQLVDALGNQLQNRDSGVRVAADATPYERIGALVARAIASRSAGGNRVDATASGILAGLRAANLLSAPKDLTRRGDLVLFVAGRGPSSPQQQQGASSIVASLVATVDARSRGVVLAGPDPAARGAGPVKAVRDDVSTARSVSTVDSLGRTAGQVVAVMALAGQAAGRSGHYGAVDAADGAMPGARPASR